MVAKKPEMSTGFANNELDKVEKQLQEFDDNVKELTQDRMNMAPKEEVEPQTKMSQNQMNNSKDVYLKPKRRVGAKEPFNERFRQSYEYDKEYVKFIAENKEIIGELIDIWTKPYPGMSAEEWDVPVNKPVWGPRYLAEQIKRKYYHRLVMQNTTTEQTNVGSFYGHLAADTTVQRLDCYPVAEKKSLFMGSKTF